MVKNQLSKKDFMKKGIIAIVLLSVIGFIAYSLYEKAPKKTSLTKYADREFSIDDVDQIGKFEIKQPKYPAIVLTKKSNTWLLNTGKKANADLVKGFLNLMSKIDIDYIPTQAMNKTIKQSFEKNGIEIKIYDLEGNLIRDLVAGSEMGSSLSLPMMVKGYDQPYMMRIPGFTGSIRSRIHHLMNEWENKIVYNIKPNTIKSITVEYDRSEGDSFKIIKEDNQFKVLDAKGNSFGTTNQKSVEAYLSNFSYIEAEYNDSENHRRNEINSSQRFARVTVETERNKSIINYFSYADLSVNYETKSPRDIHPDNKYFAETDTGEMLLVQQRVIGNIFRPYEYFLD